MWPDISSEFVFPSIFHVHPIHSFVLLTFSVSDNCVFHPAVAVSGKFAVIYLQFLIFFSFYIEFCTEKEFNRYSVKFGTIETLLFTA